MVLVDTGDGGDGSGSDKKQHLSKVKKKKEECSIGYHDEKKAGNICTMHNA